MTSEDAVRAALQNAMNARMPVVIVVRGDPTVGRASRVLEGVPIALETTRAGQARVAIEVVEGETLQKILLERIERVLPPRG